MELHPNDIGVAFHLDAFHGGVIDIKHIISSAAYHGVDTGRSIESVIASASD